MKVIIKNIILTFLLSLLVFASVASATIQFWVRDPNEVVLPDANGITMTACSGTTTETCTYDYYNCSVLGWYQGQTFKDNAYSTWTNLWNCIPFDFSLSVNPTSGSVTQGNSTTTSVTATLTSGTTQPVSFSYSGLPSGATASFSPVSCNPTCSSTLTITTSSTTPVGTYPITVTGTGGGQTKTTTFTLTVNASFDFSLSVNPTSGSVTQGNSTTTSVTATLTSGTTQPVSFSYSGLPSGATASFSPVSCNPTCSSTLTITTSSTTPVGTYPITVTGTGGGQTKTTTFTLTVNIPLLPMSLKSGWNLISFPYKNPSVANINCDSSYFIFYGWNSEKQKWEIVTSTSNIKGGIAYWIYANKACTIGYSGTTTVQTSEITMKSGWNAVGGTTANKDMNSIKGSCTIIKQLTYKTETGEWVTVDTIEPTKGYWIQINNNCQFS